MPHPLSFMPHDPLYEPRHFHECCYINENVLIHEWMRRIHSCMRAPRMIEHERGMNVEGHIMGNAATFMRMREEAELDWLSVSLLRRMVLVRSQVLSLFTPHININDMLMTWMMPNMLINARHSCMVQTLYESSTFMPRSCYSYNGHVHVHFH